MQNQLALIDFFLASWEQLNKLYTHHTSFNSHVSFHINENMVTSAWGQTYISKGTKTKREEGEQRGEGRREKCSNVFCLSFLVRWCASKGNLRRPCLALQFISILYLPWKTNYTRCQRSRVPVCVCMCVFAIYYRQLCSACTFSASVIRGRWCNHDIRTH